MASWEEARIDRLEERISRIERKEWQRREALFRWITYGFAVAMLVFATVMITVAIVHHGH